jgi:FkbM family methyltransferase
VPEIDLAQIQERLRVEGMRSIRHQWIVRPVRRILWPFVRSYFLITLEWVRDRLAEVPMVAAAPASPAPAASSSSPRVTDLAMAARAEALAASRAVQELRVDVEAVRAEASGALRSSQELRADVDAVRAEAAAALRSSQELAAAIQRESDERRGEADARRRDHDGLRRLEQTVFSLAARIGTPEAGEYGPPARLGSAVIVETAAGPMIMKPGDLITEHVQQHGTWDAHLLPFLEPAARRGGVAVDAGAHFGTLSVAMAEHFRKVHAFEANTDNFNYLCGNAALRPAGRILPHRLALYSAPTELSLAQPERQEVVIEAGGDPVSDFRAASNSGGLVFTADGTGIDTVRAVALDSLDLADVGLIKVDCQGADGHVIMGALGTIDRCRPIILFEWEERLSHLHAVSLADVRTALEARGYRIEMLRAHDDKQYDYVALPPSP